MMGTQATRFQIEAILPHLVRTALGEIGWELDRATPHEEQFVCQTSAHGATAAFSVTVDETHIHVSAHGETRQVPFDDAGLVSVLLANALAGLLGERH